MNHGDRAIVNRLPVLQVDHRMVKQLIERAQASPLGRYRLCLHHNPDDRVQEMLVVHCYDNYSRPHRHPADVSSTQIMLLGEVAVYLFDDDGRVQETVELGEFGGPRPFALRLEGNKWYMRVCQSPVAVWFEVMPGPFQREAVNEWAPWSPAEDDKEGIADLLARLRSGGT